MSDEKPIYSISHPLEIHADPTTWGEIVPPTFNISDESLQAVRHIMHEELTASKQHQHKTGMRRFTFPWGDSHVEGVVFSHASHPGLIAYVNGGIYDFCGSIHVMCAKLNILESDIGWIDEVVA